MICADVPSEEIRNKSETSVKERQSMSNSNNSRSNRIMVPTAREAMNKFKMEAANDQSASVSN